MLTKNLKIMLKCGEKTLTLVYILMCCIELYKYHAVIHVTKTIASDAPWSNCQLIIRGIEPHQQVDFCTYHCTNLTLIDTVDSRSTTNINAGPSVSTSSE